MEIVDYSKLDLSKDELDIIKDIKQEMAKMEVEIIVMENMEKTYILKFQLVQL